jgi:hypothetical protein
MSKLIEKFQRTSFTPRNYVMLPTPRLEFDNNLLGMSYDVDPNCFDAFSPRGGNTSNNKPSFVDPKKHEAGGTLPIVLLSTMCTMFK